MTDPRIELVERMFEAFGARIIEAILPLIHPEAEYFAPDTARLVGRTKPYRGFAGLQDYLRDISQFWDELRVVSLRYEPVAKGALATGRIVTRDKHGALVDAPTAWLVEIEQNKIIRVTLFRDQAKARREAGLED